VRDARVSGRSPAESGFVAQPSDSWVAKRAMEIIGSVGGGIVHHDDLKILKSLREDARYR
jgi:hypothetical protein